MTARDLIIGLGVISAGASMSAPSQAAEVHIKDAVARVVVIPEARTDIKVEVSGGNRALPVFAISGSPGDVVTIDGGLARRIRGCQSGHGSWSNSTPVNPASDMWIRLRGGERVALKDAPLITIHAPMNVKIEANGAVFGAVGRSSSVEIGNAGCGDWTIANTQGLLSASVAGSGDIHAGSAGELKTAIAGSGDVSVGAVGAMKASVAGSGDVMVTAVNGPVEAEIAGSGSVHVKGGRISRLHASIAGSGDVISDAAVGDLDASIMGSGQVSVAGVTGRTSRQIMGSGTVTVAGKSVGRRGDEE